MASLHSSEGIELFFRLAGEHKIWLGGKRDRYHGDDWRWTDGSRFNYRDFGTHFNDGDCVFLFWTPGSGDHKRMCSEACDHQRPEPYQMVCQFTRLQIENNLESGHKDFERLDISFLVYNLLHDPRSSLSMPLPAVDSNKTAFENPYLET